MRQNKRGKDLIGLALRGKKMSSVNKVNLSSEDEAIEFVNDNIDPLKADKIVITKKDGGGYTGEATFPDPPKPSTGT